MERVYILTTTKINKKQKINSIDEVDVNKILFSKKGLRVKGVMFLLKKLTGML